MHTVSRIFIAAFAAVLFVATLDGATGALAEIATAKAALKSPDGKDLGTVTLKQTPNGVLLTTDLKGVPPGTHAFHIHAVGVCEPPFKSAKGHFNPLNKQHGFLSEGGIHAGDMPNVHVPASGALKQEILNPNITLVKGARVSVFDADGSAIVMHMEGDDYKSQPSGAAGARIACGVIE